MGNIQTLRKLAVKLEPSGTAIAVENTKLYQGCYAYVWLKAYVPVTQNRSSDTLPICTVHGIIEDIFGNRRRLGARRYNMVYAETVTIDGFDYMVYERKMPKPLTDEIGDLDMVFNYSEITSEGTLSSRLASSVFHTKVEEGGESDDDIEIDLKSQEVAQINKNTFDIALIQSDIDELETAEPELFDRVDVAEKDINTLKGGVTYLQDTKIDKTEKGAPDGVAPLNSVSELDGAYIKKGQPGGVASLDGNGKVPASQLDIPGTLEYQGTWNAATNTPNLDIVAKKGYYYKTDTAGEQYGKYWDIGDWIISNGVAWQKIDNSDVDAYTKHQSDERYLRKIEAEVGAVGGTVAMRTPTGQIKGTPAQNPDELVTKEQLDAIEAMDLLKLAEATVLVDELGRPFEDESGRYFVPEYVDRWAREQILILKEGN